MPFILGIGALLAALLLLAKGKNDEGNVYIDFGEVIEKDRDAEKPATIDAMIAVAASRYGVDAALVKAIAMTESSLNPRATNPSDPSYGLMQVMPILAQDYGIVKEWQKPTSAEIAMIYDPQTNLYIGSWFLAKLTKKYSRDVAIQMYNVGESGYLQGRRNSEYLARVRRYYDGIRNHTIG
jgi:soluble lytic murein transglycosylase-like protein